MMTNRRRAFAAFASLLATAAISCTREPMNAPRDLSVEGPANAKTAASGLSVTKAIPSYSDQGTTVDVHVYGSGFTTGAQATWLLHGTADPTHVRTNSTTVVSSSELVANITVASDAQLALWDVQVALAGGKNGVGSEVFEVTAAQVLGTSSGSGDTFAYGINDAGRIVGKNRSQTGNSAFAYDDASEYVTVGAGEAWAIDASGGIAFGRDAGLFASAWIRQSATSWAAERLPTLPFNMRGLATSSVYTSDGTLLVGGNDDSSSTIRSTMTIYNRPVVWRRSGGVWSAPQRYVLPAGAAKGTVLGINARGQAAGTINDHTGGVVWEDPVTAIRLGGRAYGINAAGTLVVGELPIAGFDKDQNKTLPVIWRRNPVTGAWDTTAIVLPTLAGPSCQLGKVNAVNGAGILVGMSCNASGLLQATVWRMDMTGSVPVLATGPFGLPGLGPGSPNSTQLLSTASSVTESSPYVAVGAAWANGMTQLAVRWRLVLP